MRISLVQSDCKYLYISLTYLLNLDNLSPSSSELLSILQDTAGLVQQFILKCEQIEHGARVSRSRLDAHAESIRKFIDTLLSHKVEKDPTEEAFSIIQKV